MHVGIFFIVAIIFGTSTSSTYAASPRSLDCGGSIQVNQSETYQFEYKSNTTYDNNENCIWIFNNDDGVASDLYVQLSVVAHGFADLDDGLFVSTFDGFRLDGSLVTTNLSLQGESHYFEGNGVFLSFSSNNDGTGSGFVIEVLIYEIKGWQREIRTFNNIPGSFAFGPYQDHDRVYTVLHPPSNNGSVFAFTFTVDSIYTEWSTDCDNDGLEIYEMRPRGDVVFRGSFCTADRVVTPSGFQTVYPILTVFFADLSISGGNYSLSWQ